MIKVNHIKLENIVINIINALQPAFPSDRLFNAALLKFWGFVKKLSIACNIVLLNKIVNNYWQ